MAGRDKKCRKAYHKRVRKTHKLELKKDNDITNVDKGIGYTD
jgi:hypothetical protein